jgi:membrane associated rhomboid family serine protease
LVYALASFLIVFGVLRRDFLSLLVSAVIVGIYGGIFLSGLLPQDVSISWEGHLGGALTGMGVAVYYHFKN